MKRTYKGGVFIPFDVCWLDNHPPKTHPSHGVKRKVKVVRVVRGGRDIYVQDDKTNNVEIVHASRLSNLTSGADPSEARTARSDQT